MSPLSFSLSDILDGQKVENILMDTTTDPVTHESSSLQETESSEQRAPEGYCIECEDQPASYNCEQCGDDYCTVCFASQHRKGTRKRHTYRVLPWQKEQEAKGKASKLDRPAHGIEKVDDKSMDTDDEEVEVEKRQSNSPRASPAREPVSLVGNQFLERAKYIPLRLALQERKFLRLLEAALNVSEYTDKIDILSYTSKSKRIVAQIRELCAILSGLVMAADYKAGQELFQDRNFEDNAEFLSKVFELGRRHKIMNPDKMRDSYGKLMYLLQDAQMPEVKELLGFSCVSELKTVYSLLDSKNCLALLTDDLILKATREITTDGQKSRSHIQAEIRTKERAIETLAKRYGRSDIPPEEIRQCLYSIGDNHAFLRVNRDPCDKMIEYLQMYFDPNKAEPGYSLAISYGQGGARLSHDHSRQYAYVIQSLSLWREIQHDMFRLWVLGEDDLLDESNWYRLRDTGQGLNRVQSAPRVSRAMHTILHKAQQKVGSWVGSSVIHLGDHNVPNALMFIDKYTQIFHILLPLCTTLSQLPQLAEDQGIRSYLDSTFGGVDKVRKDILLDFFRHAFDGSGADNFFDAGSCIDGRLTSAWNWCSKLEKKPFFPVFLLTGFTGFDGKF